MIIYNVISYNILLTELLTCQEVLYEDATERCK